MASYTYQKYFTFSAQEIRSLILTIIVIGFIFSFKEWGVEKFDLLIGLKNFVNASLIVGLAFFVHEAVHRYFALKVGLKAEYKAWTFGLILGIILIFISEGNLIFLAPGGIVISMLPGLRLGHFRYQMSYITMGWIAVSGPLANIALAIFFKMLSALPLNPLLIEKAIFINVWLAVFNMLPIPPLDGSKMMYASRFTYVLLLGFVVGVGALLLWTNVLLSLLGGIAFALLVLFLYWMTFEKP